MSKNILDSRDLIERAKELLVEFENWKTDLTDDEKADMVENFGYESFSNFEHEELLQWWQDTTPEGEEHKSIVNLEEEIGSKEWAHGLQLIADSYFEEYARELAEDIGAISGDERWPATCIDWEKAAGELQYDYSSVEFDGETYWYREWTPQI